jgi:hypothetical protein
MTPEELYQQELMYFKMQMLQAEIEMQGMIAENKNRELRGDSPAYGEDHFQALVNKYGIHHNQFPFTKH